MLTHIKITSARPAAKTYLLRDTRGLYLAVQPTGSKLWRLNYRYLDKQKTLHLGRWPEIGLAAARARRDEARKQIAEGIDPAIEKKRAKIAARYAAANTFSAVAEEWLLKCEREGLAAVTIDKIRWLLSKAYPVIGGLPISQITPHEALAVLRRIEATGAYESARRMRSVLSRVFRYGVATLRCEKDVARDLRGAIATPKVRHFAAITDPADVGIRDRFQGRQARVLLEADLDELVIASMVALKPLKLLDLRTSGASRLGVPTDAVRGRAQQAGRKFSQQLYDATDFDGVVYMSRITNAECVAIYDRATGKLDTACPVLELLRVAGLVPALNSLSVSIIGTKAS